MLHFYTPQNIRNALFLRSTKWEKPPNMGKYKIKWSTINFRENTWKTVPVLALLLLLDRSASNSAEYRLKIGDKIWALVWKNKMMASCLYLLTF